jgi:hypothetical protein
MNEGYLRSERINKWKIRFIQMKGGLKNEKYI